MNKYERAIFEDLLPLYEEGLLSSETKKWMEEKASMDDDSKDLLQKTNTPLAKEDIPSSINNEQLIKKINRKLSIYQLVFIGLSFYLAIHTSMLNESFGFILSYTILGALIYWFYRDFKIGIYISFLPIFIWSIGDILTDFFNGQTDDSIPFLLFFGQSILGSIFVAIIHYLFSLIGSIISLLIIKVLEKGDEK